jgi:hypothetical protein
MLTCWAALSIVASAICLVWVLLEKLVGIRLAAFADFSTVVISTASSAMALAAIVAWKSQWSDAQAALVIDERMALKDAISTALSIPRDADPEAARLVIARAETLAASCQPARVQALTFDRAWYVVSAIALATLLSVRFLPSFASDSGRAAVFERIDSDQARQAIAQVSEELKSVPEAVDPQAQSELEDIERELRGERESPGAALQQAADALDRAADRREEDAARERESDDRLREALQAVRNSRDPATSELAKAVEDADFDRAATQARELAERQSRMTEDERREVSQELEQLADSLEELSRDSAKSTDQPQSSESPNSEHQNQSVKEMSEALKDAARQLRESKQSAVNSQDQSEVGEKNPNDAANEPTNGDDTTQNSSSDRGSEQQNRRDEQRSQKSDESKTPSSEQTRESTTESTSEDPSRSNQRERAERQQGSQQQSESAADQNRQERTPVGESAEQSGQSEQRPSQQQQSQGQNQRDAMRQLAERLEKAADRGEQSKRQEGAAERLRQQADDMRGASTPAQQEKLQQIKDRVARSEKSRQGPGQSAGDGAQKGPQQAASTQEFSPERLESVDARPTQVDPDVRRRMLSEIDGSGDDGATGDVQWRRSVEEAAKGAEKAIERRGVPRERRDFVRRVFQRYVERTKEEPSNAPARPAEDVPAGGGR